jgi:hypothetical protein
VTDGLAAPATQFGTKVNFTVLVSPETTGTGTLEPAYPFNEAVTLTAFPAGTLLSVYMPLILVIALPPL